MNMNIPYYYCVAERLVAGDGAVSYAFVEKNSHPFIWHRNKRNDGSIWTITFWKEITEEECEYHRNSLNVIPK